MKKNNKIFIIAEAGINHNGEVEIAKKMIDAASESGADAVKFQTFRAEKISTDKAQFEMLKRLELSESDHKILMAHCMQRKILFMSSPFDEEGVDFLDELGMKIFKIPSGEITNKSIIQRIASKKKPIILSTGMSYLKEVESAVSWIYQVWKDLDEKPELTLLHCVSDYAAKPKDINLKALKTLEEVFGLPVGYSDHTMGTEIAIGAVAIGARIIEKHFTLDRDMNGPDHKTSLEPNELKKMITAIRNVEEAIGDGVKEPSPSELKNRIMARKSIVAWRDVKKGEIFSKKNLIAKRPGNGISPIELDKIIGTKAKKDFKKDDLIEV